MGDLNTFSSDDYVKEVIGLLTILHKYECRFIITTHNSRGFTTKVTRIKDLPNPSAFKLGNSTVAWLKFEWGHVTLGCDLTLLHKNPSKFEIFQIQSNITDSDGNNYTRWFTPICDERSEAQMWVELQVFLYNCKYI